MDHHGHDMDHGDHSMEPMCSMNMLFTWSTQNLCIIFRGWHITSTFTLLLSLLAIVALTAGYEAVREVSRRYEATGNFLGAGSVSLRGEERNLAGTDTPDHPDAPHPRSRSPLLWAGHSGKASVGEQRSKAIRGLLYAVQVFYSFFIMLLFMTYNGWVMLAVAVGAFVGFMMFGGNVSSTKTVACH